MISDYCSEKQVWEPITDKQQTRSSNNHVVIWGRLQKELLYFYTDKTKGELII